MTRSRLAAPALLALAIALIAAIATAARDQHQADGGTPGPNVETDARRGEPPLPLTPGEQAKFAAARAAVDAAEAAGTRWVAPRELPDVTFAADADAAKLARLRAQEPDPAPERPGIADGEPGGSP